MRAPCPETVSPVLGGKDRAYPEDETSKGGSRALKTFQRKTNCFALGGPSWRAGHDNLASVLPTLRADGGLRPCKIRNEWHEWKAFKQYEDTILHAFDSKIAKE